MLLLAAVCGVAVGNVYFPQSITPAVAAGLHVSAGAAAGIVTAGQAGYTAGLFLLVPLGDRIPHRRLLTTLLVITSGALLLAAAAPGLPPLIGLSVLIGAATVIAPVVGPLVAGMVPPQRRGETAGLLLSGGTGGMLLSRTFGGYLAQWWSWRVPYVLSAVLLLVFAALLRRALPPTLPATRRPYPALLLEPLRLLARERDLRRSCLYQASVFAAFCATWTCVALLLTGPAYGYDARAVGLLALVNAATMLLAPVAGRRTDRHGPDRVNLICAAAVVAAAALLALGATGGIGWLVAGTLVLDVAMQSGMVANQVRVYAISDSARSRRNTAYMTCAYAGGAGGSWLGLRCYQTFGWPGVCVLVGVLAAIALIHLTVTRAQRAEPVAGVPEVRPPGTLEPCRVQR
ncbi:MFS transporter [Dactylosporangium siamense]|uniref:MFS transporter n=1 Tax=Dactylosporangium siamense TaxID=685454 RepID=A0A919PGX5_9ACTN|nr:MFS transporter [Dactylosporangium siamense]